MAKTAAAAALILTLAAAPATAQPQPDPLGPGLQPNAAFLVEPVAETIVAALPAGPLYWRVESYPTLAAAPAAAGPLALAAEAWGRPWLVTLGPKGATSPGATEKLAEMGPVPIPEGARRYRLRLNRAGGPPGVATPVHTHPGSEAFYVLKGQLTQRMGDHRATLDAGQAMNGHAPGLPMQLTSTGPTDLEQLVLFVVDADKPFSVPARFD